MPLKNTYRFSACPYCQSEQMTYLGDIDYGVGVKFGSLEISLLKTPELWRCKTCATLMTLNALPAEIAQSCYTQSHSGDRWTIDAFRDVVTTKTVNALSPLLNPGVKVLDIGCGSSDFLSYAAQRGCKTFAFELSQQSVQKQQELGHQVLTDLSNRYEKFDLITLLDVIEHLYDPQAMFSTLRSLLTKNGQVAILTGNPRSVPARIAAAKWWYVKHPEHVCVPTAKALKKLSGFKLKTKVSTFAKIGYKLPLSIDTITRARNRIKAGIYDGLPSVIGDHQLVILSKDK